MSYAVDYTNVSTVGLESSPVADALAGLRANEARYFKTKYDHTFSLEPAAESADDHRVGARHPRRRAGPGDRVPAAGGDRVRGRRHLLGLCVLRVRPVGQRALHPCRGGKRAVGFKLSDGMEVPDELAAQFKFARQKSKLAGTIRGTYFVIKGTYELP